MALFNFGQTDDEKGRLSAMDENFAVISFKPDGTIITANTNFLNALGYSLDEVVGQHHKMFCTRELANSSEYTQFWNDLGNGKAQISEFKRIKKDGESIFIHASYSPVKDSSGVVTRVIKFAQDITKRKLQALDYSGQLDAIHKSRAVIEFNMDGTIIKANDNFTSTVGYSEKEIIGKHHSMFCESAYKSSNEYKNFWRTLNEGQFQGGEYQRVGNNGKVIWLQATYNPIFDIDGKPFKVVKYATDITNRKITMLDIENNVMKLTESLSNLSHTATSMTKGAEVTTSGSQEVSSSTTQISQSVSDVAKKVSDMLVSIKEVSKSSQEGKNIADEAKIKSKETTSAILKLDEESSKISDTVNSIAQIAFQTNILSLNAAVEAATAGEAGKGFAVVAQEVRNLASRSDEATKEITDAIVLIQSLVKTALDSINNIDNTIEKISSISEGIVTSVNEQESISNNVSSITGETSLSINEIAKTMIDVSESAENSGRESIKTLEASEELEKVSSDLIQVLKSLK
ncbi:PAS domain-containing methyl-accepting chemotaxis protein [Arcobacteraceae bacterium]|nr:PAS domain-containing methyl-accepting chemotaxis protein [Arcobacteraceae bacterium]